MRVRLVILAWLFPSFVLAQELFPHIEPASNIPSGVLGLRLSNEFYQEVDVLRSMQSLRLMWGFNPKFMITQAYTFANHHGNKLPEDFVSNDGRIGLHTHGTVKGNDYPYRLENVSHSLKYRFYSLDGMNKHIRLSANLDFAFGSRAHDESEPSFMGDNAGIGGGLTATWLYKKFAVSLHGGYIVPYKYVEKGDPEVAIHYGNALLYNLSMGYLLFPFKYKSYKQTNLNLYVEFIGKSFDKADVRVNDKSIIIDNVPGLEKGDFVEIRPAIQFIIHSNTRIDFSIAKPVIKQSFVRIYPVYYVNIQHYFFF